MSLVDLATFRTYQGSTSTGSSGLLQACLDAADREILNFCHRTSQWSGFEASSSSATRYYRANDIITLPDIGGMTGPVLWLDAELLSVTSLLNGTSSAISSTGYWLEPRNNPPYKWIRLKTGGSWIFDTDGEIEVQGTWGFSTGPDAAIQDYVKQTAKYKYEIRASAVFDITAQPDIGIITIPKGMPANVKLGLKTGGYIRTLGVY